MGSAEDHVEGGSALRRNQQQPSAVAVTDDTARQGKSDPPSLLLGREAGVENLVAYLSRHSRTVVGDAYSYSPLGQGFGGDLHLAVSASQGIDGILGQRLERPLEKDRVSLDHQISLMRRGNRHALCESGDPRTEVRSYVIYEVSQIHRLLTRGAADSLEAVSHTLETLQVRLHVIQRRGRHGLWLRFPEQLDPAADARKRRSELMRGFPRHPRPDLLPVRSATRAQRVCAGQQHHGDQ